MTHSITIFPAALLTAIEMLSLCTSLPIYLLLVIEGSPFWGGRAEHSKPYSKRGAPFDIASDSGVPPEQDFLIAFDAAELLLCFQGPVAQSSAAVRLLLASVSRCEPPAAGWTGTIRWGWWPPVSGATPLLHPRDAPSAFLPDLPPLTIVVFSVAPCHTPKRAFLRFPRFPRPPPAPGPQSERHRSSRAPFARHWQLIATGRHELPAHAALLDPVPFQNALRHSPIVPCGQSGRHMRSCTARCSFPSCCN